jgi:Cu-Zn family superoxide dismutase
MKTACATQRAKFESAGAHYNPEGDEHGYHAPEGHHEGDMPNLTILPDGTYNGEIFNEEAELEDLTADNGAALMIHEKQMITRRNLRATPVAVLPARL